MPVLENFIWRKLRLWFHAKRFVSYMHKIGRQNEQRWIICLFGLHLLVWVQIWKKCWVSLQLPTGRGRCSPAAWRAKLRNVNHFLAASTLYIYTWNKNWLTVSQHDCDEILEPKKKAYLMTTWSDFGLFFVCFTQLHVAISKTNAKVFIDCKMVVEKNINAAGNISTDGVEVLGRMVRSRANKDNSAPVNKELTHS